MGKKREGKAAWADADGGNYLMGGEREREWRERAQCDFASEFAF